MSNQTSDNLAAAFAGESQASRRYIYFAEKAEHEGYPQIARLFRAAAEAETIHARNHLDVMGQIGTTMANLEAAASGEHYEFTHMYPGFIEQAGADGNKRAGISFNYANKVEQIHHTLFRKAIADLAQNASVANAPYYVCPVCGYTAEGDAPDRCPVCGTVKAKFKKIE